MPIIMRMVLVLPEPFGPNRPNIVPGSMTRDSASTATLFSYTLRMFWSRTMGMAVGLV